ncbi:hypothetical protein GR11A_00101 [Vibrio phage vB_VcorM_GR11A]|nr:hypothetical protein GR11A_00101 [Vibrio phage vB_VcorM_GR11A]
MNTTEIIDAILGNINEQLDSKTMRHIQPHVARNLRRDATYYGLTDGGVVLQGRLINVQIGKSTAFELQYLVPVIGGRLVEKTTWCNMVFDKYQSLLDYMSELVANDIRHKVHHNCVSEHSLVGNSDRVLAPHPSSHHVDGMGRPPKGKRVRITVNLELVDATEYEEECEKDAVLIATNHYGD